MTDSHRTQYSPETPWLCWDAWAKVQTYEAQNPSWFKQFTSLWTDPEYASVWEPHGDAGFALIHRLLNNFAVQGTLAGVVWGDPALLQRQLRLTAPPDLSWLLDAGWIVYISDKEKAQRDAARYAGLKKTKPGGSAKKDSPGEPSKRTKEKKAVSREEIAAAILAEQPDISRRAMAEQLGCSPVTVSRLLTWRERTRPDDKGDDTEERASQPQESRYAAKERGEESREEQRKEKIQSEPSGAPFTNNTSLAAIAAPPETETGQTRPQGQPEAQQRPEKATGNAQTLALVPDLPKPISALLGLRRDSAALPPESDALGKGRPLRRNPSPTSFRRPREPGFLAGCLGPLSMAKQCPEVWDWVSSVFKLLRFSFDINSVEGRRETGSFSAMYNRVMLSPLPLGKKTEILVSSLKTAKQKGRKPDSHYRKGKGAVFCDILNQRLDRHLATQSSTANENHQPPKATPDPMRATG